jgi:hypothetical protein
MKQFQWILASLALGMGGQLLGQAGLPDSSFGGDGIVYVDASTDGNDRGEDIALQADGKIVVAGAGGQAIREGCPIHGKRIATCRGASAIGIHSCGPAFRYLLPDIDLG